MEELFHGFLHLKAPLQRGLAFALANDWGIRLGFLRYFSLIPPASLCEASPLEKGGFKSGTVKTVPYGCAADLVCAFKGPLAKGAVCEAD